MPALAVDPQALAARPSLALRYRREVRVLIGERLRVACWVAFALIPIFGVLDVIRHPQMLGGFILIRLGMVTLAAAALLAARTAIGRRHLTALSFVVFCETGLGVVLMTTFIGGGSSPYYAGVNLVILAAAVLMPWEAAVSAALGATLIGAYAVVCLTWAGVPNVAAFATNLFFLCSTALIAVVSHAAGANARRREFLQRVALEEAGRHRDEFLANITHELRTPLAAILGFGEMLEEQMHDPSDDERGWLRRIRENATTLYRLIVQLLDFSKIEAGALTLERERVDLAAIVTKVAADMRAIAGEEGTEVQVQIAADAPVVMGDPARIEEIVTNLASNALKFSEGQPVSLTVKPGTVSHTTGWQRLIPDPGPDAEVGTWAEIAVRDRGRGIQSEDLGRLFVAFQQLDGSSTRRQGGTGLGLAISARLVAAMRGHIAVRSTVGGGSTFAVLLPVAIPTTDVRRPTAVTASESVGAPAS